MPIDSSIYFQQQTPDFLGSYEKGMRLSDMGKQRAERDRQMQEDQDLREAYKSGVTMDENGNASVDQGRTLSALAKVNPLKAVEQKKQFEDQGFENLNRNIQKIKFGAQIFGSAKDQGSYDQALGYAKQNGLDVSKMPAQFDPEYIKQKTMEGMSLVEKMQAQSIQNEQKNKDREFGLKEREIGIKEKLFANKLKPKGPIVTEGQKAVDKDYAKDYNDWTSQGSVGLENQLALLKEAKKALETDSSLTGSIRGNAPDAIRNFTNEKAILTRDMVRKAASGGLRLALGSAFTEKEGERIMNQSYNEKLSPKANIDMIDRTIAELEEKRDVNDKKAIHFEKNGSLNGFNAKLGPRSPIAFNNLNDEDIDKLYQELGGE